MVWDEHLTLASIPSVIKTQDLAFLISVHKQDNLKRWREHSEQLSVSLLQIHTCKPPETQRTPVPTKEDHNKIYDMKIQTKFLLDISELYGFFRCVNLAELQFSVI